jgi:hypothetical protein
MNATAVRTSGRRRTTEETPERWAKALARAFANGLEVFRVADTGELMVTSATKLDTLHRTDGRSCTCEAALAGDRVCQHRAVARFVLGWPPAPVAPICRACGNAGHHPERRMEGGESVVWEVPCACPAADRWVAGLLGYDHDDEAA